MIHPFFSIIIPSYNRDQFITIAINSILCQTFANFEIIVVDDGSRDNTIDYIKNIKDSRLIYLKQQHRGVSSARNIGILAAKGKYICFLDSDDRFRTPKLEITKNYIHKFPQFKIFHTEEIWYRNGKILAQKKYHQKPEGDIFAASLQRCCVSPSTATVKKEIFNKVGYFDENLKACEDYDFWLRVSTNYPVKLIPEVLTLKEGGHSSQQSKKFSAMDRFRIYAIRKLLKYCRLTKLQQEIAFKELENKCRIYLQGAVKRNKDKEIIYYNNLIEDCRNKYG